MKRIGIVLLSILLLGAVLLVCPYAQGTDMDGAKEETVLYGKVIGRKGAAVTVLLGTEENGFTSDGSNVLLTFSLTDNIPVVTQKTQEASSAENIMMGDVLRLSGEGPRTGFTVIAVEILEPAGRLHPS